jgi:alpha-amylase
VNCAGRLEAATPGQWVCEHRDPWIAAMVAYRRAVAGSDLNHSWDDGASAIAFSRGTAGFIAINNGASSVTAAIPSALSPGTYCDLLTGGRANPGCAGRAVTVGADGRIAITLEAKTALALLASQRP